MNKFSRTFAKYKIVWFTPAMDIGIDIGSAKTVIYSSANSGAPVEDRLGNKEINTVMEETVPRRTFGNEVAGDAIENIEKRRRFFFPDIQSPGNQDALLMFLNYLDRTIKNRTRDYRSACIAIPENFNEEQTRILKTIVESSALKASCFITHLTSVAASAALRNLKIAEQFMIIDCGYSKTSVGLFKFVENRLTPLRRWTITRGGKDFDDAVISILIKNYGLTDCAVVREMIYKEMKKIKRGLNTLEKVITKIFNEKYEIVNVEINRSEYLAVVEPTLNDLRDFFRRVKQESEFTGHIEVVGNNRNNVHVQEVIHTEAYSTTLGTTESVALGACLALAVNTRNMQLKVDEILGRDIYVGIVSDKKHTKPTLVFPAATVLDGKCVKVNYNRKGMFVVEVFEEMAGQARNKIGVLTVNKQETEKPEVVSIAMKITPFMTVEVAGVSTEGVPDVPFSYEAFALPAEKVDEMVEKDRRYGATEEEHDRMDQIRHELEHLVDTIDTNIEKKFPGILRECAERIDEIREQFFESPPAAGTVAEMEGIKKSIHASFGFVSEILEGAKNSIRQEAEKVLEEYKAAKAYLTENTYYSRQLVQFVYQLEGFLLGLKNVEIDSVSKYDSTVFPQLKAEISRLIPLAIAEEDKERAKKEDVKKRSEKGAEASHEQGKTEPCEECPPVGEECPAGACDSSKKGCSDQCCHDC